MKTCTTCSSEWPDDTKFCPSCGTALRVVGSQDDILGSVIAETYHIVEKIGEGGMGAVYLGEHVKIGRKSAIKVMSQALSQDSDAAARFHREAENAARINHPNVCAIYDFGETQDGLTYLAMEFIEGESLTSLLKREGPLGLFRAVSIARQTANALQAAHDLGIVHRDLKPDNIMLTKGRDGSDMVKVVDFGIAKAMGSDEHQTVTRTGLVVGTPEYMSPEQLSGDVLDGRSDIYSLALVFFRMATGVLPFQADSAQEVMMKRLTDEPLRLRDAVPSERFPPELQRVLDHGLQRMPQDRTSSAEAFARELHEAASAAPTAAQRAQPVDTETETKLIDSTVGAPAPGDELAPTRVASAAKTQKITHTASTPDTPMPQTIPYQHKRGKKPLVAVLASVVVAGAGVGTFVVMRNAAGEEPNGVRDSLQLAAGGGVTPSTDTPEIPLDTARLDSGTPDTARTVDTGQSQTGDQANVRRPDPVIDNPPALNLAAIKSELVDMIDAMDDANQRPELMRRAQEIYNDTRVPNGDRAFAAAQVSAGHFLNSANASGCMWLDRALQRDPANTLYVSLRGRNCSP